MARAPSRASPPAAATESTPRPPRMSAGAERDAAIDILAEHEPGESQREQPFEIEQQRAAGGGRRASPSHEQHRRDDAAGEHRRGEPRQIGAPQRRLAGAARADQRRRIRTGSPTPEPR